MRSFGLDKLEERGDQKGATIPEGAFDEDGDINLLALIPIEIQGSIETFLYFSTGKLIVLPLPSFFLLTKLRRVHTF